MGNSPENEKGAVNSATWFKVNSRKEGNEVLLCIFYGAPNGGWIPLSDSLTMTGLVTAKNKKIFGSGCVDPVVMTWKNDILFYIRLRRGTYCTAQKNSTIV